MKFKYTILYVDDVTDTLNFYESAFDLEKGMLHESGDYGELNTGNTTLSFSSIKLMKELGKNPIKPSSNAHSFEIAFETTEVETALAKALKAGATLVQDAKQMPWGQTVAYVSDKNGFLVEICSPVAT